MLILGDSGQDVGLVGLWWWHSRGWVGICGRGGSASVFYVPSSCLHWVFCSSLAEGQRRKWAWLGTYHE